MSRKLLLGTLALSAGALALIFGTNVSRPMYSLGVADFQARPRWDERVRLNGTLVRGTLCKVDEPCEYRFRLGDRGESIPVSYEGCVVPDTFRDVPWLDVQVSAEGEQCQSCHHFKASSIMAKVPGKYEMSPTPFPPIPRCPGRKPGT